MAIKQFLAFSKLLLLLLLSNPVMAEITVTHEDCHDSKSVTFFKAEDVAHKDGLQPQIPSVRIISEHHAKPISFGYPELFYNNDVHLVLVNVESTQVLLQDANRCESVSRFLFPYHFFW